MYRYSPPKSNIWGHSLGSMEAVRQRELFAEFLKRAVADYSFTGGSLSFIFGTSPADVVRHFEQLLGTPAYEGAFYRLTPQQCEAALTELIQRSSLLPDSMLLQNVDISRWLIEGQPVTTQSEFMLYYGRKPCISTFLQFETVSQFKFIQRVLKDLDFCKLNEKHLKPIKQRTKKKSGGD